MPLFKNPKKYGDLHKKWKALKQAAETKLKADIQAHTKATIERIKAFEKDPVTASAGKDVETAISDYKKDQLAALDSVFDSMNCDRKKSEAPSFSRLFPDFDKGFGAKLDAYEKAAKNGSKDTGKKREAATKVADKYEERIKLKITQLKKFKIDTANLKKCQSFLTKFNAGDEDGALKVS